MPVLNPIQPPLAADLPTNWQPNQIVSPDGVSAGLSEQHGYNHLMEQVNAALQGVNALGQTINGLPEPDEVGGYFQIPQGDNLPATERQPNSLYGQVLTDYTAGPAPVSGLSAAPLAAPAPAAAPAAAPRAAAPLAAGASRRLGDVAVGTIVKLNESGDPVNYIVVQQGSPSNLYYGFENVTCLLRQDIHSNKMWDDSDNRYAQSSINSWLNGTFLNLFDSDIRAQIANVKIPHAASSSGQNVQTGINGLSTKAFLLSMTEVNLSDEWAPVLGVTLSYFNGANNSKRIAKLNGAAKIWWSRSPDTFWDTKMRCIDSNGDITGNHEVTESYGARPVIPLNSDIFMLDDGTIITNQPPTAPGSIEATNVVSGGSATVTITAATDPDGTIASYVYERSVDGGQFTQFASVNSLTTTDSIQSSWGTVAYRAAAVDNYGSQGPYVTSETYTVNSGWVIVGGPVSNLGVQDVPFELPLVVNVTGGSGVTGINLQVLLDGAQIFNDALNQGASVALPIDTRAMASGQHEIQAIAEKEDYLSASVAWYFVVPSMAMPEGGYVAQLQDDSGNPIFPPTFARNVMGTNGKSVQTELDELASAHKGTVGHLAFVDAVLGPATYNLTRASATTYAYQYFAPAAADTSSQALVSVYPSYTGSIGSLLTASSGSLDFNVPSNGILSLWQYVVDVTPPASTDPTVNFTTLIQPQVVTASTNTGNTASDLNAAITAMMKAFPAQNYYTIVDAMNSGITYYVASQAIITATTPSASVAYVSSANPTTWYQGVQLTFVDTSNMPAQFSYMSAPIVTAATSANPVTAGDSLNATLTAMIKAQPTYNRYMLEDGSGDLYYICSPTQITAGSVSAAGVLYCTTDGTYYNGESLTLAPPPEPTLEVTE